jgi:nucleoside-diphosphate-sugar epimerase
VTLHAGDVRSFAFLRGEYQYVIHAATEASAKQAHEAPLEMLSTIIAGTGRTLEFAVTHTARKFLLTSSGAVSGNRDRVTIQWSFTRKQARKKFGYRIAR